MFYGEGMKENKKNKNIYRVITFSIIFLIFTVCIFNFNCVYGKINETYGKGNSDGAFDVEQSTSDSSILKAIAWFIYHIAEFVEDIITYIMGWVTSSKVFPYADAIIFNSLRFLDVNFISPDRGSVFLNTSGEQTIIGKTVGTIYYTIFTLSIAFLGVAVGVMAIKLVISSIAEEKAKYKQAIKNWIFALILVFASHYLVSFIFFVNEQLVEVASNILLSNVGKVNILEGIYDETLDPDYVLFCDKKLIRFNVESNHFIRSTEDISDSEETYYRDLIENTGRIYSDIALDLESLDTYIGYANDYIDENGVENFDGFDLEEYRPANTRGKSSDVTVLNEFFHDALSEENLKTYDENTKEKEVDNFFSDMSIFFKYYFLAGGQIIMAILYAIFIVQSLMYLVSYLKRLFYIVTLALFAPIIVIFDFVTKIIA